jgi:hypothetical protein
MSWGEAVRLVMVLLGDPMSETCAAVVSTLPRDDATKGRPVEESDEPGQRHIGDAGGRSPEEVREMLRAMGHKV